MQTMTRRGRKWLSEAADDPEHCASQWDDNPRAPHPFPTGRDFDIVVVEQRTGVEVFSQLQQRGMPHGPVMTDLGNKQVGFLVAPGSRDRFDRAVIRESEGCGTPTYGYLATGSFVVLPGPMPLSGDRYQWLAAPTRAPEPSPLRVVALAVMLVAATRLLERVDRYGEEFPVSAAIAAMAGTGAAPDGR